jgi:c-di-GMP-related signal transduction protein
MTWTMEAFVARQPILDRARQVYGYELLFRSGLENFFSHPDLELAAAKVIYDSTHVFGLDTLAAGRRVFVNATRRVLVEGLYRALPQDRAVIEVLETVEPDDEVEAACRRAKAAGYLLALDDFVWDDRYERLLPWADVVKVDFTLVRDEARAELTERLRRWPCRLLAEKVETPEDFDVALELGYQLFQGYFFFRPEIVSARAIPPEKLGALPALGSAADRARLFDALAVLGRDEPRALLVSGLVRARFCELLGVRSAMVVPRPGEEWAGLARGGALGPGAVRAADFRGGGGAVRPGGGRCDPAALDLFRTGLLSAVDALVGRPLEEVVHRIAPAAAVREAVLGRRGELGRILALALAYERGAWDRVDALATGTPLAGLLLLPLYGEAVEWAERAARALAPAA